MQKKRGEKVAALLLCASMLLASMTQGVFAEDPDPAPIDPEVYQLAGTVYQYPYSGSESSASAKSGETVVVNLKTGTTTLSSGSGGKISYTFTDDALRTESGTYSYSIQSNADHLSASGTIEEGTESSPKENRIYIRERYIPKASDYEFSDSENVKKIGSTVWIKEPGSYEIKGASGKNLSKTLDGTEVESLSVSISADGSLENFYIYTDSLCSKVLAGQKVRIDNGAPVVSNVTTEAANNNTYVKEHGIYGKEKAEIVVTASINEESLIKEVFLVSEKDGESLRYDAVKVEGESNKYSATIGLPDEETIMNAQLVKLVAVDIFGNKSAEVLLAKTEEGSKVTLEQIPPELTLSASGKKSSYGWYSEKPTLSAKGTDTLSGLSSLDIYGHEDGEDFSIATGSYKDKTTDEKSISGIADFSEPSKNGQYTYTAKAVDNSGNERTENIKVNIDLVAPKVSASGITDGEHYSYNPEINIKEDEKYSSAKGNRIFVTVKRAGQTVLDKTYEQTDSVTVPKNTFSSDGLYTVTISARDAADNASNTLTYRFTKDATSPKLSISGVKDGRFYNRKQTVYVTVKERNWQTNNVSVSAVKKLGGTKNMGFPWKNKAYETVNSKTYSETGTYTITASARDKAGNSSGTKKVSFTIDTKAPVITISGVSDGGIYTYGQGLAPKASVQDDYLASKSISFTKGGEVVQNPSFEQIKENDGLYTMIVTATDKAGNSARKEISFTVNRFGSYFIYNDAIKNIMGKAVQSVPEDLVVTERNVSKVTDTKAVITRDGGVIDAKGTTRGREDSPIKEYKHTFAKENFEQEGAYEINVISKDEVGNEMESKQENGVVRFFVDKTAPTISISGINPKGNKGETANLTIGVSDLLTGVKELSASVNGEEAYLSENGDGTFSLTLNEGLRQDISISATDGAGNTAEVSKQASVSSSAASLFFDRFKFPVIGGLLAALATLLFILFGKRRKKDKEGGEDSSVKS